MKPKNNPPDAILEEIHAMRRAMCIWIPDWSLQRLALERPELRGRTVVLYEASPQGGLKVLAATPALGVTELAGVRDFTAGIYPGMPLAEATALVAHAQAATTLAPHLEPADLDGDRLALVQLAEWCQCYSPIVGVEDAPRPDCLLLDITGLEHLFGGEQALAGEVHRAFTQRGLSVRVALADTIGAAWAAVHAEPLELEPIDFSIALPPRETLAALASLPIGYLRVAEKTTALLATLGIYRVGELAALPRSALLSRFGSDLLRRLDQALGRAPEMIVARHAAAEYAADFTFEAPIANREAIEHVLGQLIGRLTGPLSRRQEGVLALVCRLNYERAFENLGPEKTQCLSSLAFSLGLFRASAAPEYLCDLLGLRLQSVRLAGPVTSVHVEVVSVGPLELRQQALFDADSNQDQPRRLAGLVDRLSNRLGRGAVVRVALLADAQPEYTCVDAPLAGDNNGKARVPKKNLKKNVAHVRRYGLLSLAADERPLLLPQPARIEVVTPAPHSAPAEFRWAGSSYSIAYAWGPERIETGWWRTAQQESRKTFVRRDYYRVETNSGARFWIFRQLGNRQWFLHGRFE